MKSSLPRQHNPFADYVLECVAGDLYLASQMRAAGWNESDGALVVSFSPDVPRDLATLRQAIVERFRAMAKDQAALEEMDDPGAAPVPLFPFRVAAESVVVDGRAVLLVKVFDTGDGRSGRDGLQGRGTGGGYGQSRPTSGPRIQTTPP